MEEEHKPTETLYLIDGHAQIFRAYYAIRGGVAQPGGGTDPRSLWLYRHVNQALVRTSSPVCRGDDGYAGTDISRRTL